MSLATLRMRLRRGSARTVTIEANIDAEENVVDIRVTRGVFASLDDAALAAVRRWKFYPGTRNGEPIAVKFALVLNFNPGR